MMGNDTEEPSLSDELLEQAGAAGSGGTSRSVQPCDMSVEMILALGQGGADDVFAPVDPEALLAGIRGKLDAEKFAALIDSCQRECLEAVIRPFGIGRVLFENSDRSGGPVATPHNMRKQYSKNNLRGSKFKEILVPKEHLYGNNVGKYRTKRCASAMGRYKDARSGMGLANIDEATGKATENPEVNHLNPLRKFHVEGNGFMLSDAGKEAFACDERNFILIDRGANRSQREQGYDEWKNKPASDGDGRTNGRKFEHDGRRTKHKKAKADQAFNERAATPLQKMSYYAVNISKTGLAEGRRMALQQALGVVMEEFVRACFAEVKDAWHNGFAAKVDESFLDALSVRLNRVAKKVLARWKDASFALRDGFLSGFLSNLITVVINTFATTAARQVRMLREGGMALYRALKTLVLPDEGVSLAQAADAATEIFAAGLVTAWGIAVEGALATYLEPLGPLASDMISISVGLVTGLGVAFAAYMLERLDFFGVHAQSKHEQVMARLDEIITISQERIKDADTLFDLPPLPHLT